MIFWIEALARKRNHIGKKLNEKLKRNKNILVQYKGYKKLKDENNLEYLILLSNKLANTKLSTKFNLFEINKKNFEKCVTQFLIQRRLNLQFNHQILVSLGREKKILKLGLPKSWLTLLEEQEGLKANTISNHIRWISFVFFWFLVGNYEIIKIFIVGILKKSKNNLEPFVYFNNLSVKSIPKRNFKSKTIIDWYLNYFQNEEFDIAHDVKSIESFKKNGRKIIYFQFPFKVNLSKLNWIEYLLKALSFSIKSFFLIFKGDHYNALLLREFPLLYLAKSASKKNIAKKYLFHNSTDIYRPLWTYETASKGSEVILYYYSANNFPLTFNKNYYTEVGNRKNISWNNLYVWNKFQKEVFSSILPNAKIKIVGPILFESSHLKIEQFNEAKKIISIFDIQPLNETQFQRYAATDRYYSKDSVISFHKDILKVFKKRDYIIVVLKRKRKENFKYHDVEYLNYINNNYNNEIFCQLSPDIDAYSLIEKSFLTISFPPTSTALISNNLGVNCIYYDPLNKVDPNDKTLSGIKLLRGYDELEKYISKILD